ncbi:MAG: radical SAM protein [Candidatus Omnitrophica bacterium]|nr:radical SAM protein [Candidatus Omnitrophota bacterium]
MGKVNFKSALSRIQYPYKIIKNKLLHQQTPLIVVLVINNKCNLKCKYCFGSYCDRDGFEDFTTMELKSIIDQLSDLGTSALTIHGGETLLRKDLGEIVDYIKRKKMYLHLVTNGLLLKEKVDLIRGVDSLCISLDGDKEGHEKNRGKNTFQPTVEAIKFARSEGFPLRVHATITRHTKDDVEFLSRLAKDIGFFQYFSVLYPCGGATKNLDDLILTDQEIRKVIEDIVYWKKKGYPIFTSYPVLENVLNWPFEYSKAYCTKDETFKAKSLIPCAYGRTKFIIDADGSVYPCFGRMDTFSPPNVKAIGVSSAFELIRGTISCDHCIFLTNNDHNLLLSGSLRQIVNQCFLQTREIFSKY